MVDIVRKVLAIITILLWSQFNYAQTDSEGEWEYLFLDAFLAKTYLDTSIEVITQDFETFYLPLDEVSTNLALAITTNPEQQSVHGWFITESNTINIDLKTQKYQIGEKQGQIESNALLVIDETIYISHKTLKQLLSIEPQVRTNVLKVNFESEHPLPRQAKLKRQQKRKLFELRQGNQQKTTKIEDKYHWLLRPNIDISSQLNWQSKNEQSDLNHQLSLQGASDFALHQGSFSLRDSNGEKQMRVNLAKQLTINNRQWHYQIGDIQGYGRGFAFSNGRKLEQQFGKRRFEGDAQPGWEAELYRNDNLLNYQEIGTEGRYLFEQVPVQIGDNQFKIILYGPQGQQKVIEEHIIGHQLAQKAGQWTPSFSLSQPNKRILPLDKQQNSGTKLNAAISYGISDSIETAIAWQQYKGNQQVDTRLTGVWQSTVFDIKNQYRQATDAFDWVAQINTQHFQHDWGLGYNQIAEENGNKIENWQLDMSGSHSIISPQDNYSVGLSYSEDNWSLFATHSANFDNLSLNNRLTLEHIISDDTAKQQSIKGNGGISFRLDQHQFRFEAEYIVKPQHSLENFSASYSHKFDHTFLQLRANLRQNDQPSDYSANLSWQFDQFRLGARLSIDEHQNTRFGLTFSMGLGVMPSGIHYSRSSLKNTATIKAQTFLDTNNNGIFDVNEQPVAGIGFKGNQKWQNRVTDESGIVYLLEARTARGQYVEFIKETLDDPFLTVDETRYNVFTHPGGLNELYFPIYEICEVEGEIVLKKGDEQQAKAAVPLLLIDQNGKQIQRILSEYDGFFIFTNVKPGQYRIEVEQGYLKRKGYSFNQSVPVDTDALDEEESLLEIGTLEIVQE